MLYISDIANDVKDLNRWQVAMDNCTDVSIFCNKDLLTNLRKARAKWIISGHKRGSDIELTTAGDFYCCEVLFSREASCNVLCQYDARNECGAWNFYEIPGWGVRMAVPDGPLDFVQMGKRYVLDTRQCTLWSDDLFEEKWNKHIEAEGKRKGRCYIGAKAVRNIGFDGKTQTVQGNSAKYTLRERERAARAIDLMRTSGFRSATVLADMLKNGGIANCDLTYADLERGLDIYGKPKGYWDGKLHDRKSAQIVQEYVPPLTKKRQIAHCDIMFIGPKRYFVCLVNPMSMAFTLPIAKTSTREIVRAIKAVTAVMQARGLSIHTVVHDPEKKKKSNALTLCLGRPM